jgi:hypothetical protein
MHNNSSTKQFMIRPNSMSAIEISAFNCFDDIKDLTRELEEF